MGLVSARICRTMVARLSRRVLAKDTGGCVDFARDDSRNSAGAGLQGRKSESRKKGGGQVSVGCG